jgi:hypothetical protein
MRDAHLASSLVSVRQLEAHARACGNQAGDEVEKVLATEIVRLTVPLGRKLEALIAQRACRTVGAPAH